MKTKKIKKQKTKKQKKMKGGNKQKIITLVSADGMVLRFVPEFLKDKEVVLAAVNQNGLALKDAPPSLQNDKEVVLIAVKKNGLALQYASQPLQNDKEVVLVAVSTSGKALFFASNELSNDEEVCLVAVTKHGDALDYVSDELKDNEAIVTAAVSNNGSALEYASLNLRNNEKIVTIAVSENAIALRFASAELKDNDNVVRAAITNNGEALYFASDRLKQNREFIEIARLTFDDAHSFAEFGKSPQLFRQQSTTFTNQSPQGVCGRHVFPRVIIKNIFELLYPLPVNETYDVNNCNKYLATGKTIADLNQLSIKQCSQGGYIKILLFLHLFYLYQEHVPTIAPHPKGWLECNQVHDIYDKMFSTSVIPNLKKQLHTFMLTNVLHDIKSKIEKLQIKLITFQLQINVPLPGRNDGLFDIIQKITREGLYLMLRVERRDDIEQKSDHWAHFLLVTGTSDDKILLKNSWGTNLIFDISLNETIYLDGHMWNFITDFSLVIPVIGDTSIEDADLIRLDTFSIIITFFYRVYRFFLLE